MGIIYDEIDRQLALAIWPFSQLRNIKDIYVGTTELLIIDNRLKLYHTDNIYW